MTTDELKMLKVLKVVVQNDGTNLTIAARIFIILFVIITETSVLLHKNCTRCTDLKCICAAFCAENFDLCDVFPYTITKIKLRKQKKFCACYLVILL